MLNEWSQGRQLVSQDDHEIAGRVIEAIGVVPVVAVKSVEDAVNVAGALSDGGVPVIEITLRTPVAIEAIAAVRRALPNVLVGAGTVLDVGDLDRAIDAGAQFAVAPGFSPPVGRRAIERGLPFLPGVATPSEITAALAAGFRRLKFFPAETIGGVSALRSLIGPFGHTGVSFVPTGGISLDSAPEYWRQPFVAAVGGSWLVPKAAVEASDWQAITKVARATVAERAASLPEVS